MTDRDALAQIIDGSCFGPFPENDVGSAKGAGIYRRRREAALRKADRILAHLAPRLAPE